MTRIETGISPKVRPTRLRTLTTPETISAMNIICDTMGTANHCMNAHMGTLRDEMTRGRARSYGSVIVTYDKRVYVTTKEVRPRAEPKGIACILAPMDTPKNTTPKAHHAPFILYYDYTHTRTVGT